MGKRNKVENATETTTEEIKTEETTNEVVETVEAEEAVSNEEEVTAESELENITEETVEKMETVELSTREEDNGDTYVDNAFFGKVKVIRYRKDITPSGKELIEIFLADGTSRHIESLKELKVK